MKLVGFGSLIGLVVLLAACNPVGSLNGGSWGDAHAPMLVDQRYDQSGRVELEFDEDIDLAPGSLRTNADQPPREVPPTAKPERVKRTIAVDTAPSGHPGQPYTLAAQARDKGGNTTQVLVPYYGVNPRLPRVLINELGTKSSTTIRDTVELRVMADGNLVGLSLVLGTTEDNDGIFTFDSLEVKAGDYLLVHCKPEGLATEIDEYADIAASGGKNASAAARDFWIRSAPGLSDSSGVVTLCSNPVGEVIDAIFYCDKVTIPGKEYDSFGTKKLQTQVLWLAKHQAWTFKAAAPRVEDGARAEAITATRTLCRNASAIDTNHPADWHVVPTSKSSFGGVNTDEAYSL